MCIVLFADSFIPVEITKNVISKFSEKTWSAFCCTCKENANIDNWPEERIVNRLSYVMKNFHLNKKKIEELFTKIASGTRYYLIAQCIIRPINFLEFFRDRFSHQFESGQLHLMVDISTEGKQLKDIHDSVYIESLTFQRSRIPLKAAQVLETLVQLSKVHTLKVDSSDWLREISPVKMPTTGLYYPSFPSITRISLHQDISSFSLLKLFRLFPNIEKLLMNGLFPSVKIELLGTEQINKVKNKIENMQELNAFDTKAYVSYTLSQP